jgi:hypothetical protein
MAGRGPRWAWLRVWIDVVGPLPLGRCRNAERAERGRLPGWERQASAVSGQADSGSARGGVGPGRLACSCRRLAVVAVGQIATSPDAESQVASRQKLSRKPNDRDREFGTTVWHRANGMAGRGPRWAWLRVCQGPPGPPCGSAPAYTNLYYLLSGQVKDTRIISKKGVDPVSTAPT